MNFKKIKSSALVLTAVVVLSKLLGMCRDVVLANYFGTSNISDAYLTASTVPTLLFYFIGHALTTAFLPMYNKVKHARGKENADAYANNLMTISLLLSTVLVFFLLVFPTAVVKIFAPGFGADTVKLAASFIRISAVSLYFMTVISIWTGYLQSINNFIIPAFISVPRNLIIMLSISCAATIHISILGIGLLLAYVAEMLLLLPFVKKSGYRLQLKADFRSPDIQETLYIVLPIILGTSISQINKIIDKAIASTVVEGAVSALSYASVINNAIQEVLVTSLITILFADCAKLVAQEKHEEVKAKLFHTTTTFISVLLPATVGLFLLARQIVTCLLLRGNFDELSAQMTTTAFCCYTFGLCFLALRDTFVKVLYAYKKTSIATKTSAAVIIVSIVLKITLSKPFGVNGLALATSFSAVIHSVLLYITLKKTIGSLNSKQLLVVTLKAISATVIMAISVLYVLNLTQNNPEIVRLCLCIAVGIIVYAVAAILVKLPLATQVLDFIFKQKRREIK